MKKAEEIDTRQNIAAVDAGANLKAFVRMDGAWPGSIDIALKKARTAMLLAEVNFFRFDALAFCPFRGGEEVLLRFNHNG